MINVTPPSVNGDDVTASNDLRTNGDSETGADRYLEQELQKIRNGSNGEVARLAQSLHEAMGKRVATADRFRKLHIHNANQLYDYEVAEATATFERALEDAKERIINETVAAHREQMRQVTAARGDTRDDPDKSAAVSAVKTRRTADKQEVEEATSSWGAADEKKGAVSSKRLADRHLSAVLADSLPDDAVRADFVTIVRDMEQRSEKLSDQYRKKVELDVSVLYGVLTVREPGAPSPSNSRGAQEKYTVGSFVSVYSTLTEEDYVGIVTSITPEDVIIRLGTGTRLRVFVQQIRDRRIVIRIDDESKKDMETINAAKRMRVK